MALFLLDSAALPPFPFTPVLLPFSSACLFRPCAAGSVLLRKHVPSGAAENLIVDGAFLFFILFFYLSDSEFQESNALFLSVASLRA